MAIICCPWCSANMSESTLSRFFSILGVWEQFQHHLDLVPSLVTDRMGTRHGCHGAQKKSLQVRHSSVAVNFFVSFKLSRTNSNYLEWRAISPGQCAKTWADLSSGPQVNAACPKWIMVTQGFFLGAELSCFFLHFFFARGWVPCFFIVFPAVFINFPIVFANFPAFFLHFP